MKKVIKLTEKDLQRIVKRVIKEEFEFNVDDPSFGIGGEEMEDFSSTWSYYDPKHDNYQTTRGTYQDHNEEDFQDEWDDYEFDDFTELKHSDIPNDRWRNLRTRKGFDSMRGKDNKVRIRKNPHHFRRVTKNRDY
tara:strand:- start:2422 stop:2826 length:405 start_codon:yes stop_codon:yes gene_type:complete